MPGVQVHIPMTVPKYDCVKIRISTQIRFGLRARVKIRIRLKVLFQLRTGMHMVELSTYPSDRHTESIIHPNLNEPEPEANPWL